MNLDAIIERLPVEYQGWARQYSDALLAMMDDEVRVWTAQIVDGNWQDAYEKLVAGMTTEQVIEAQKQVNMRLQALNQQNASFVNLQKQMVADAVRIGLMLLARAAETK